jgi:hypothetical protein
VLEAHIPATPGREPLASTALARQEKAEDDGGLQAEATVAFFFLKITRIIGREYVAALYNTEVCSINLQVLIIIYDTSVICCQDNY